MAIGINNNTSPFAAANATKSQEETNKALQRIASGLRINTAADDAAGFSISQRLTAYSNGLTQAYDNLQNGASMLQIADAGMANTGDMMQRLRELAVQSANGTLTDEDRAAIQTEADQILAEINRSSSTVEFNGQQLLTGETFTIQVGGNEGETLEVTPGNVSTDAYGLTGLDLSTQSGAQAALGAIDSAIAKLSGQRAEIGSQMNRIDSAAGFVGVARENTLAALSSEQDTDFALASTQLALSKIRNQTSLAALTQSNLQAQNVLKLLG